MSSPASAESPQSNGASHPSALDRQKMYDAMRVIKMFIDSQKEIPPAGELASKLGITEDAVANAIEACKRDASVHSKYAAMGVIQSSYKLLVQQNINPDHTLNTDAINAAIAADNTCCTHRLAAEYGVDPDIIDGMKATVADREIAASRINAAINEYGLNSAPSS